ncbi:MAG TPA: VCBS repeat-containing protein [Flavitalea sp.]|nr:VCBS repeat-containing protein [Flavitalea sp.]
MSFRLTVNCLLWVCLFAACRSNDNLLFKKLSSGVTNIDFTNTIRENEDFNILTYEYLYNGGGVAAGDLNNDGLTDLVFSGNMVPCRIYLNKGNFHFQDITDSSGFRDRPKWKTGVVMADVNGDGAQDIYLCYSGPGSDEQRKNQLFINSIDKKGMPHFTEESASYGLDAPGTYSTTAVFFDQDNDHDLDMFLVNHADMFYNPFFNTDKLRSTRHPKFGNRFYRNDENKFTDISDSAGINGSGINFGLSVSASDINQDGWTDLYVTNDYDERDFLYINNHKGGFSEVLDKVAGHISEFAMGSDIADYNNDGNSDIIVLDMLPEDNHRQKLLKGADGYDKYTTRYEHGFHRQQMRNTIQMNNGISAAGLPILSEVGQLAGVSTTDWSWAPLFADLNNDGRKDLFITNGIYKDITNLDFVKYTSEYSNNFSDKKGDKKQMWELIKDMPSTRLSNYFYMNNGRLGFTDMSSAWNEPEKQISNGAAYADLDNDGDLDLIINRLDDPAIILQNRAVEKGLGNFVRIKLEGDENNTSGIGSKIWITTAGSTQYFEQFTSRGFQSSVSPIIHAGLGKDSIIKELRVVWPGGSTTILSNLRANGLVVIPENTSRDRENFVDDPGHDFTDFTQQSGINFLHRENRFVDFKISPLLPFQPSKSGPSLARGDANEDGLEDLFIGASGAQGSFLYLQQRDGSFAPAKDQPWNTGQKSTVTGILFFDADHDGDNDLYLVSGGTEYAVNARNYQDRLYVNKGSGNFQLEADALPVETNSGSCVAAGDLDKDSLPDLFIGSKFSPGSFPVAPGSILLKNDCRKDQLHFVLTGKEDSSLSRAGMISDAVWVDMNQDGWQDLVIAGLFMPITVFENHQGQLTNSTKLYGLEDSNGWWQRLIADDIDNDGYIDLVAGNIGTNTNFNASPREPLTLTFGDFNGDGVIDPILCNYNQGKSYPVFSRDELFDQIPGLQKKFGRYADYADAELSDIFSADQLASAKTLRINTCQSVIIMNKGGRKLSVQPMDDMAQMSMNNGIAVSDVDGDKKKDIIVGGNFFPMRVQQGPMDASIGMVLKQTGAGEFKPLPFDSTGLDIPGDVRQLIKIKTGINELLIAAKSSDSIQVVRINR